MKLLEASLVSANKDDTASLANVPSLAQICEAVIVHNLRRYSDVSPLSATELVNIILKARIDRDPEVVLQLEQSKPELGEDAMLDEQYWQPVVERMLPARPIPSPFQTLKADVSALAQELPAADTDRLRDILRTLSKVPVSVPLLSETGVGKLVKSLSKHEDTSIASEAKLITTKWKATIDRVLGKEVTAPAGITDGQLNEAVKLAERSPATHTWRQVFLVCKELEQDKMKRFGKRSREQAEEIQATKRRVQQGDEGLNVLAKQQLSTPPSKQAPNSTVPSAPAPLSMRAKYMREMGHERPKSSGKRTKLLSAVRNPEPRLRSTVSHRVVKTSAGSIMKIPRAFDPANQSR